MVDHADVPPDETEGSGPRLVLGLGNPGSQYRDTRHNVGFWVVEELARRRGRTFEPSECNCLMAHDADFDLAMPQTFMNRSGHAARCLAEHGSYAAQDILVVYDDVALPLGRVRLRAKGSPGGHRGMESIVESLRSLEIPRLRVGIASSQGDQLTAEEDLADFVLSPFDAEEREVIESEVRRAADACESWAQDGATETMNRFNG